MNEKYLNETRVLRPATFNFHQAKEETKLKKDCMGILYDHKIFKSPLISRFIRTFSLRMPDN